MLKFLPKPTVHVQRAQLCSISYLESNEISIQVRRRSRARVLTKWGSQQVYNTIPKFKEWLTIYKYFVDPVGTTLPRFYIFKGKRIQNDYIQLCKPIWLCSQKHGWLHLFSKILFYFQEVHIGWNFSNK
jgi:hypothetical protein